MCPAGSLVQIVFVWCTLRHTDTHVHASCRMTRLRVHCLPVWVGASLHCPMDRLNRHRQVQVPRREETETDDCFRKVFL